MWLQGALPDVPISPGLASDRAAPLCQPDAPRHDAPVRHPNRSLLKQPRLAMDAATKRQVAKLGGAGTDAAKVLASLCDRIEDAATGDAILEAIAARLEEVPAAREQLVQQLEAGSDDALCLLSLSSVAEPSPAAQRWKRVLRTLATSEELGPRAVSALVAALAAGSGRTLHAKELACKVLGAMAQESKARAREAAAAGVFVHLVGLLGQRAAGELQEVLMRSAIFALVALVRDSSNRLQLAARQGVLQPLAGLLGADQTPWVQERAAHVLGIFLKPGALPDAALPPWEWLLGDCVRGLAGLLARPGSSADSQRSAGHAMNFIVKRAPSRFGQVAEAAVAAGAVPVLVRMGLEGDPWGEDLSVRFLSAIVTLGSEAALQVLEAGGLDVVRRQVHADRGGPLGRFGDGVWAIMLRTMSAAAAKAGRWDDCTRLACVTQQLGIESEEQYGDLLKQMECERQEVLAKQAAHEAAVSACAQCGAQAGAPGVQLRKCSACGKACYCGVQCQRAHWRQHKPQCSKR